MRRSGMWLAVAAAGVLPMVVGPWRMQAQRPEAKPSQSSQEAAPKSEEYLILGDANRGAGEPMIAVNRKDPSNIVIAAMATLHRLPNGEAPDGPIPPGGPGVGSIAHAMTQRVRELSTQDETVTDVAVTHDGGKTREFTTDGFRQFFKRNRCHDSFAGAGADGTMFFGCIPHIASDNTDFDEGYTAFGEPTCRVVRPLPGLRTRAGPGAIP